MGDQEIGQNKKNLNSFGKDKDHNILYITGLSGSRKVFVEGVQIFDGWLTDDYDFYKDQPIILLKTNATLANKRAMIRYNVKNDIDLRIKQYIKTAERLDDFQLKIEAENGQKSIDDLLRRVFL